MCEDNERDEKKKKSQIFRSSINSVCSPRFGESLVLEHHAFHWVGGIPYLTSGMLLYGNNH